MRRTGRLRDWNDARGFGFIEPHDGGERVFLHVRALAAGGRRPVDGDLVDYAVARDARGRPRAMDARFAGRSATTTSPARHGAARGATASRGRPEAPPRATLAVTGVLLLTLLGLLAVSGRVPVGFVATQFVLAAVTYLAYLADKSAAVRGRRRTPESTLHLLALAGGWPGAALAQRHLHHKWRKPAFMAVFRACVALHVAALAGLAAYAGRAGTLPP